MKPHSCAAVVLAGQAPKKDAAAFLHTLAETGNCLLIAADGGADTFFDFGLTPHLIIGDNDSRLDGRFTTVPQILYHSHKDLTDGEAALRHAAEAVSGPIYLFGAGGGRPDHFFANLTLPLFALDAPERVILVDDRSRGYYSKDFCTIQGKAGDIVSLLPLTPVREICLSGMEYPLSAYDAAVGDSRTISNVMLGSQAQIQQKSGWLLIFHLPQNGAQKGVSNS